MIEQGNVKKGRKYNPLEINEIEVKKYHQDGWNRFTWLKSDVWKSYRYIVAMSQRCFNYAYLYAKETSCHNMESPRIISETALLGEVKTITQQFLENASFPMIFFIDDVIENGFLLYKKIENSISLNLWNIAISKYIEQHDILMTSSVISAFKKLPLPVRKDDKVWEQVKCEYRSENKEKYILQIAYSLNKSMIKPGVMLVVRYCEKENKSYYTPFVFHGSLKRQNRIKLFEVLRTLMNQIVLNCFLQDKFGAEMAQFKFDM